MQSTKNFQLSNNRKLIDFDIPLQEINILLILHVGSGMTMPGCGVRVERRKERGGGLNVGGER